MREHASFGALLSAHDTNYYISLTSLANVVQSLGPAAVLTVDWYGLPCNFTYPTRASLLSAHRLIVVRKSQEQRNDGRHTREADRTGFSARAALGRYVLG